MFRRSLLLWCMVLVVLAAGIVQAQDLSNMWNAAKRITFGLDKPNPAQPIAPSQTTPNPPTPPNTPDVRVFPSSNWQEENSIGVSVSNPNNLMISVNGNFASVPTVQQPWFFSTNGGTSWFGSESSPPTISNDYGDPVAMFNLAGKAFWVALGNPGGIFMTTTTNFGTTWSPQVNADPLSSANDDKEHAACDLSGVYPNNVYAAWTDFGVTGSPIIFTRSTDAGATWSARTTLSISNLRGQGVHISTGPNGEVYVMWAHYLASGNAEVGIGFAKSTDGGATFNTPAVVFPITGIRTANGGLPEFNNTRVNSFPNFDVDRSSGPRRGTIYCTYSDRTLGQSNVYIRKSTNGGTTWSDTIRINGPQVASNKQAWFPSLAVDQVTGGVTVSYYQMDSVGTNFLTNRYAAYSIDGGVTWDRWVISDVRSIWQPRAGAAAGYAGDYFETAAHGGKAWPCYSALRGNPTDQAYVEIIQYPLRYGWVRGTVTQLGTTTPIANAAISFVDPNDQQSGFTNAAGLYLVGIKIDSPATTRNTQIRGQKFGYVDTTIALTARYPDTTTFNFQMRPSPGGTLAVRAHRADNSSVRARVGVNFGGSEVTFGFTDSLTGNFSTPLPVGTYDVIVDPPSPYGTRRFLGVVIAAGGTTNIDALVRPILEFNPTAMRDTLPVNGVHAKTLVMTNTTPDTIRFRISDDNARIRFSQTKPLTAAEQAAVKRSTTQQDGRTFGKGAIDPRPGQSPQGSGGPDAFGYKWVDSDSVGGGVTFNWTDIRATGTQITTWTSGSGDDGYYTTALPWSFPIYGTGYTSVNIGTNGFVNFGTGSTSFSNVAIPSTSAPFNGLFAYWDDLNVTSLGAVHYYNDVANSQFVVQYTGVPRFGSTTDSLTFQIIVRPNGEIRYQYLRMVTTTPNSATIGIQNGTGTVGLQVVYNAAYVHDGLAVKFYLPDAPWLSENPFVGAVPPNSNLNITCTFDATGLQSGTTYRATMFINAPHPDNTTGDFTVPASLLVNPIGTQGVLSLNRTNVTFPSTVIGSAALDTTIVVTNVGGGTLTVSSISTVNGRFTVTPTSASIPSTGQVRLRVTYTPIIPAGNDTGKVILLSNSAPPSNGRDSVWLYASSYGIPRFRTRPDSLVKNINGGGLDSTRFYARNAGTQSGSFAARAIMYPRTEPNNPIAIPMTVKPATMAPAMTTPNPSLGPAPNMANRPVTNAEREQMNTLFQTLGIQAFGINLLGTPANALVRFDLASPGTLVNKGTAVSAYAGGMDGTGQYVYAIQNTPSQLIRIDTSTAAQTVIGPTTVNAGETWTAMKFDGSTGTWYATSTSATNATLYTINPLTGASTIVAAMNLPYVIGMALDNSGQMYCYTISSNNFYRVNKTTGVPTLIGPIGFSANYAQDMDFDRSSNTCYMAAYSTRSELRTVNVTTGGTTLIGPIGTVGTTEIDCFAITGSTGAVVAPWLSVRPPSGGPVAIGDSVLMTAYFDARDPSIFNNPGSYFGRIEINGTNTQGVQDTLKVPVRMTVAPNPNPKLFVTPDSVNFGTVIIGATDSSKSILVKNIGAAPLNVTNITISNPAFSVRRTSFTLNSLDTTRLKLYFQGVAPGGNRTGTLTFTSNSDPPVPIVKLVGTVVGQARIVAVPDTFFFSRNSGPDTTRTTFKLRNPGTDTLRFRIDETLAEPSMASIIRSETQQDGQTYEKGVIDPRPGQSPMGGGGPDAFGYRWIDSDEPGGPAFSWTDIRTVGTAVTLTDDSNVDLGAIGFTFNFYGVPYTNVRLCSNGWLSFTSTSTSLGNTAIPNVAEPNTAVYGFWDDLNPASGGTVHYYRDVANNRFVIQFTDIQHYGTTEPGVYTFQMILYADGRIVTQYLSVSGTLNSSTIGIENETGTVGLQVVYNSAYVHNNLAILFSTDILTWASVDRTSGTVAPGDSTTIQLRIHPLGITPGRYTGRERITGNTPDTAKVRLGLQIIGTDTSITVNRPNGGEQWVRGQGYQITWTVSNPVIDTVDIAYSVSGNAGPWRTITSGTPGQPVTLYHPKLNTRFQPGGVLSTLGAFNWTIPDTVTPSANCFVRVRWKRTPSTQDLSNAAFSIIAAPPDTIRWVPQTSGFAGILYSVKTVSDSIAWACGAGGRVLRTTNAGTTWANAGLIGTDCYTITALSATVAVTASSPASGAAKIWKTTDGGATWVAKDSTGVFYDYVHMWDANNGIALGDPVSNVWVIRKTTNGGETWNAISPAVPSVGTEAGWNNSMMWFDANNGWFGTNASKIYRSTNGGNTWASAPTTFVNSYAMNFDQLNVGLAGGSSTTDQFNRSTDAGASWAANGTLLTGPSLGMSGVRGGTEFWVTTGTFIAYSSNSGTTWTTTGREAYNGGVQMNHVNMITNARGVFGWAVSNTGGVARYKRYITDVSAAEALPTVFALDQNYPNPFNPSTTIRFSLPEQANVTLRVYDVLGREVRTLVNGDQQAGYVKVVWDGRNNSGSQVASGIYFYRMEATGVTGQQFTTLKKAVMLK